MSLSDLLPTSTRKRRTSAAKDATSGDLLPASATAGTSPDVGVAATVAGQKDESPGTPGAVVTDLLGKAPPTDAPVSSAEVMMGLTDGDGRSSAIEFLKAGEESSGADLDSGASTSEQGGSEKKGKRSRKAKRKLSFEEAREAARSQLEQHDKLKKTWMQGQRGALAVLPTTICTPAVESWFKRTFLKHARMLGAIRRLPRSYSGIEAVDRVEEEILSNISRTEVWVRRAIARNKTVLATDANSFRVVYDVRFQVTIKLGTRSGIALHGLYMKVDEYLQTIDTLFLQQRITPEDAKKARIEAQAKVFGCCRAIEGFYGRLRARITSLRDIPDDAEEGTGLTAAASAGHQLDGEHADSAAASTDAASAAVADASTEIVGATAAAA